MWFDRTGTPIDPLRAAELFNDDDDEAYHRVGLDHVRDLVVSTVWLGLDHGHGGPLRLFETMIFQDLAWDRGEGLLDQYCLRYATYEEAQAGHADVVAKLRAGITPAELGGELV